MSLNFEWTKDMSVGNSTIDIQHQHLLSQVNKIIEAVAFGRESEELKNALDFFDKYIKEHLSYEEQYMDTIGFPKESIDQHKKNHDHFVETYAKFKDDISHGVPEDKLLLEIERYLGNWWVHHIGVEDHKYRVFLEDKKKA